MNDKTNLRNFVRKATGKAIKACDARCLPLDLVSPMITEEVAKLFSSNPDENEYALLAAEIFQISDDCIKAHEERKAAQAERRYLN